MSFALTSSFAARSATVMPSASVIVRVTGGGATGACTTGGRGPSRRTGPPGRGAGRGGGGLYPGAIPGRGDCAGRTGCEGSGRGPPIGPGLGGNPGDGRCGERGGVPGAPGRNAAGRLRFPVGACGAGAGATGGRTSIGRLGGAGGAWPVRGSSTLSCRIGGTTRPVGGTTTGRGAGRPRPPVLPP